jgi:O-antigen/teichoic acid export membrane protein
VKFVKGPFLLLLAEGINKFIFFLLIPFFTNQLNKEDFFTLGIYQLFFQLFSLFFLFSLNNLQVIDTINKNNRVHFKRYLHKLNFMLSFFLFITSIIILLSLVLEKFTFDLSVISLAALMNAIFILNISYSRALFVYKKPTLYLIITISLYILLLMTLFYFSNDLMNRFYSFIVAYFISSILFFHFIYSQNKNKIKYFFKLYYIIHYFNYGARLVLHSVSSWLRGSIDKFLIGAIAISSMQGDYMLAFQVSSAFIVLFTLISQQLQPFIFKALKNNDKIFYGHIVLVYFVLVIIFFLLLFIFLDDLFYIFFPLDYKNSLQFIYIFSIGVFFNALYFILSHTLFYYKYNQTISNISFLALLISLIQYLIIYYFNLDIIFYAYNYSVGSFYLFLFTFISIIKRKKIWYL